MRSSANGPFATLLIFVPLVAVPALAIFGFPQFPHGSPDESELQFSRSQPASPPAVANEAFTPVQVSLTSQNSPPAAETAPQRAVVELAGKRDPIAEFEAVLSENAPAAKTADEPDWSPPDDAINGWAVDDPPAADKTAAAAPNASPQKDKSQTQPTGARRLLMNRDAALAEFEAALGAEDKPSNEPSANMDAADAAASWKEAVGQLNSLGIKNYRIEPGRKGTNFHFSCQLPSLNTRVNRRFEAEADDPLRAVTEVLRQVRDWSKGEARSSRTRTEGRLSESAPVRSEARLSGEALAGEMLGGQPTAGDVLP